MPSQFAMVAAVAVSQALPSAACTIAAVGAEASASGHPIMSHTDDSGMDTTDVRWVRVPRRKWPAGSMRPLYNWNDGYPRVVSADLGPDYEPVGDQKLTQPVGYIPQVPETYAYWDMDYGAQNEEGLSIGESTCTCRTVGWPATPDKPYGYNHAGIEDLSKIALERCDTARCAVQTMGDIAVEQGFYSADSGEPTAPGYSDAAEALAVADLKELWIFNVMTGPKNASALWAAMRVPADHVAAVGNSFTIRQFNLSDSENFLYSPGVWKLAEEMGWWSRASAPPGTFDFFGSYGFTPSTEGADAAKGEILKDTLSFYSSRRMWRIFSLLSPAEGAKLDPNHGNLPGTQNPYPSSVLAPKGSVTAAKVMEVLRDYYQGTPYDLTAGMGAGPFGTPNRGAVPPKGVAGLWERAISMHRTSWSHVLEPRPNGRSIAWLGYDSPHGTAYLPFFAASAGRAPESFRSHEGYQSKFSTNVAYWAFNFINQYSDLNFKLINSEVREQAHRVEDEGRHKVEECNAEADRSSSPTQTLTECSNKFAEEKVAEWWEFAWSLVAKYRSYTITTSESATGAKAQQYPEWWINSIEVGYTTWAPWGPYHGVLIDEHSLPRVAFAALNNQSPVWLLGIAMIAVVGSYQFGVRRGSLANRVEQAYYIAAP